MRPKSLALLWIAPLGFLALFYFYPLGSILQLSFARSAGGAAGALLEAIRSAAVRQVLWFTLWQAALSTLLTLLVGLPGAYLLARYQFRGKSWLMALASVPFVLPTPVVAAAFHALLGPRGWANTLLMGVLQLETPPIAFVNSLAAILAAHVFYNTTIVLRVVGDFWSRLDPRLWQAAQALGASRRQRFLRLTLPLLAPAIAAASLLVFIFDFTSFGVILLLGGPRFATLEVAIYQQATGLFNLPLAAALSLIQLVCTLSLTVIYSRLSARLSRPLSLRPRTYTQQRLRTWRARLAAGLLAGALLVFFTLPLAALALRSVTSLEARSRLDRPAAPGLTLDYYRELGVNRRGSLFYVTPATAIAISLGYAAATVLLALALGLPVAWALARGGDAPLNRWLDPLLLLPLGTSAVTLGLGFIVALDRPPLDLRASPLLPPLAHTLVAFPFVVRSLTPALRSVRPRLRQAAAMLGASPWQALRRIELPIIGRALLVGAAFAFSISMGEFGATAVIARPEYPTIPIAIYRLLSLPGSLNYGQAMALSAILMAVTAGSILAIDRLRTGEGGDF